MLVCHPEAGFMADRAASPKGEDLSLSPVGAPDRIASPKGEDLGSAFDSASAPAFVILRSEAT